ncbi:SPOR domain-containing protein [Thermaurantiacus sp.]
MIPALGLALLLAAPAAADTAEGVRRWQAGDWAGAVAAWREPAARGEPEALFNLGQAYKLGRGVAANADLAIDFFARASASGHVPATANLGIALFQAGRKTEALLPLRTAADAGDARAAYVLGVATFTGDGAPRNPVLGLAYVLRAEALGLALAAREATRMAAMLAETDRARARAAAEALATGQPVAVAFAPVQPAPPPAAAPAAAPAPPGAARATAEPPPPSGAGARPAGPGARQWAVQLGAYSSEAADLLAGHAPVYAAGKRLVRLQVGPFAERSEAAALCAQLAAAGRPCFVTGA